MPFPDFTPTAPVFIRELAGRHADKTLIVFDDERLSYREAEERSARLSRALLSRGVGKGTRVGLLLPNSPDWIVSWLAVARIGAIAVPLNTFFQTRELAWILRHADIALLLTRAQLLSHDYLMRLEQAAPGLADAAQAPLRIPSLPYLREIHVFGESDRAWSGDARALIDEGGDPAIDDAFLRAVEENVTPADPMLILYSSGSTADPKGAVHTHGSILRHSYNLASQRDLVPEDNVWSPMPFFWVGGFVFSFLGGMHAGATMLCETVFDPETTLAFLERERCTVAVGWPHFGKALADHPSRRQRDLSSLRAGNIPDILPEDIVPLDPALRANALGMTETGGPHTWAHGVLPEALRGSFGTAVDGVQHKVVDPDTGATLPAGEFGELCVRGYSLMQSLYKQEREDVFDAEGFYHTGDGGYFDENGVLYFKARLGDMIKSGGANVTPGEVEAVLASFPELKAAHVVGVPDPDRGENVAAAVVCEVGQQADGDELRKRLKGELSAYKVPRHVFVVDDAELPFTDSGKIDKRRLREQLAARIDAA